MDGFVKTEPGIMQERPEDCIPAKEELAVRHTGSTIMENGSDK